jgi:iron complex transport system substrate-binding protein
MTKKTLTKSLAAVTLSAIILAGCASTKSEDEVTVQPQTQESTVEETETLTEETSMEETSTSYTFMDDLGRLVTVDNPQRVVTMIGSFTDVWMLAGGSEVVATANDSWTSFDLGLSDSVINFGSHTEPDVEQIIAAQPDFIIASANTDADIELMDTFEDAGITTAYFSVSSFDDYLNMLGICTAITGRDDLYIQNGVNVATQIDEVRDRVAQRIAAGEQAPTVLFLRASTSSIKAKGSEGTVGGEILADLGCINIADSDESLLDDLSMEAIIAANPDYIFVTTQGTDADAIQSNIDETLLSNPAWSSLDAVKNGRYYVLEKELYNLKPNARWGEAYEKLEAIIFGEE